MTSRETRMNRAERQIRDQDLAAKNRREYYLVGAAELATQLGITLDEADQVIDDLVGRGILRRKTAAGYELAG